MATHFFFFLLLFVVFKWMCVLSIKMADSYTTCLNIKQSIQYLRNQFLDNFQFDLMHTTNSAEYSKTQHNCTHAPNEIPPMTPEYGLTRSWSFGCFPFELNCCKFEWNVLATWMVVLVIFRTYHNNHFTHSVQFIALGHFCLSIVFHWYYCYYYYDWDKNQQLMRMLCRFNGQ